MNFNCVCGYKGDSSTFLKIWAPDNKTFHVLATDESLDYLYACPECGTVKIYTQYQRSEVGGQNDGI